MKRIIASMLLVAILTPFSGWSEIIPTEAGIKKCLQPTSFTLKGIIKGQSKGHLVLSYTNLNGKSIKDSCAIVNGTFQFKGQVKEPVMAYISGAIKSQDYNDPNFTTFYLEPGLLSLVITAGDFKHLKLTGSKTQNELTGLERSKSVLNAALAPLSKLYEQANNTYIQARKDNKPDAELELLKEKATEIREKMEPYWEKMDKLDMSFIKTHLDSYHAAYLLQYKVSALPLDTGKKYYAKLSPMIKESSYGKAVLKEIESLQGGSPGSKAKLFNVKDVNGVQLDVAELNTKNYLLLDFWASWCVPCRKGNPHLLSLYSKYKDKGLEIVGISDDDGNLPAWKKAVEQDHIGVWKHVLRGLKHTASGFDKSEDITEPFGIHTLPTKILIDKNGMIIGRYGGGGESDEAMDKKLAEIFSGTAYRQQAQLNGNIKGLGNAELSFYYYDGDTSKTVKVPVVNDKFTWTAAMPQPQKVTIMFPKRAVWLYLEGSNMELNGYADSLSNLKLTGSKIQDEANAFEKMQEPLEEQMNPLYQKYGKVNKEEQLALEEKIDNIRKQKGEIAKKYIAEHPESAYSLSLVTDRASMGGYAGVKSFYDLLGDKIKATPEGKRLTDRLVILKRSAVGEPMLNFTQNNTEGKPVSFSAFKGKYVLVDFWASWCGPCRAENPNVLKAYNSYKNKNFTVVGISLDDKGDNWKKAIKDDGMPWTQLSDLKGWKNEVSTYYGIMGIPSTLLIDPQGIIIAKDLRGEILNKKLQELFNN